MLSMRNSISEIKNPLKQDKKHEKMLYMFQGPFYPKYKWNKAKRALAKK